VREKTILSGTRKGENSLLYYIIFAATCLLLLIVLSCSPPQARHWSQKPQVKTTDEIISEMKERLHMTEQQVSEVRPIIEEEREARRAIIEKYAGGGRDSWASAKSELQDLRRRTEVELSKILTPEQLEEYRELSDEQANSVREKRGGGHMAGRSMHGF
jgi:Spy/CpxP family protein refolding chaperone